MARDMKQHQQTAQLFKFAMDQLQQNRSELARTLNRSTSTVGRYINGDRPPPPRMVRQLAKLCGFESVSAFCEAVL